MISQSSVSNEEENVDEDKRDNNDESSYSDDDSKQTEDQDKQDNKSKNEDENNDYASLTQGFATQEDTVKNSRPIISGPMLTRKQKRLAAKKQ
eukprot:15351694-Ditylum_brightwellii.AAC.1